MKRLFDGAYEFGTENLSTSWLGTLPKAASFSRELTEEENPETVIGGTVYDTAWGPVKAGLLLSRLSVKREAPRDASPFNIRSGSIWEVSSQTLGED